MPISITFLGAARTVTGSAYLVDSGRSQVMVDFGMFQGRKEIRQRNWVDPEFPAPHMEAVVLTHTHLDHIGRIPRLTKNGFKGPIFCTPPTVELAEVLLKDAAHLQMEDAEYLNRKGLTSHKPALPLFDDKDVERALKLFVPVPLGKTHIAAPGISFMFREAGHLLGASSIEMTVEDAQGSSRRILFSGDLGRYNAVLAKDPEPCPDADYVLIESTYGNRQHPVTSVQEQLQTVIARTFARNGVLLIPAFAVGRAQQMIWLMDRIVHEQKLRPFPIYIDSPMAVDATRIYARHGEALKDALTLVGGQSVLNSKWVRLARSREESEALNKVKSPAVIISSSGMLSGGRILHHCRVRLPHPENTLLITGYQGEGTLGRRLIEKASTVRIHKTEVPVLAEVTDLKGLSGHADVNELMRWLSGVKNPPKTVFVTHGEEDAALTLAVKINADRGFKTHVPRHVETVVLD
ncbi:MAG TPA: MBL fold metallo-hydrolase [Vicinamibacteria bacterium]|nr:MBL fold metallo-hydrolase [Vicinamibacteria bacterium]HRB11498.1 MBL fold metallo-hydrolase [Vicinamibacteria bacterium]